MLCAFILALAPTDVTTGAWHAWLDSPGGELPFDLVIESKSGKLAAVVINGSERIEIPDARFEGEELVLAFPHYDATVRAKISAAGARLDGEWKKRKDRDVTVRLPFHATAGATLRFPGRNPLGETITTNGRYALRFEKTSGKAVAIFDSSSAQTTGTFLTSTGDYRYLAGNVVGDSLWLSTFDGAHAFLIRASRADVNSTALVPDLRGDFWSGDTWHETWTAKFDPSAKLDDELALSHWNDATPLALLQYPDLDGNLVSLGDSRFAGRVRILQLTGSWCPNCQDETAYLAEIDKQYANKPLSIVALCFETTGERERDVLMAKRMLARHNARYTALLAGRSDKSLSQQSLPGLDKLVAFPTTLFLSKDGRVRAVHAGYSGPATGDDHAQLEKRFEQIIDDLLADPTPPSTPIEAVLCPEPWRDERDRNLITFERTNDELRFTAMQMTRFDGPTKTDPVATGPVTICGASVSFGGTTWHFDARAKVLLDPNDYGRRLTPGVRWPFPVIDGTGIFELPRILEGLQASDPLVRRDCAYYLALQIVKSQFTPPEQGGGTVDPSLAAREIALLSDPDPFVRATASWAAGYLHVAPATGALVANLSHGFAPVRRESARALRKIGSKEAIAPLAKLDEDIDPLVRAAAREGSSPAERAPR